MAPESSALIRIEVLKCDRHSRYDSQVEREQGYVEMPSRSIRSTNWQSFHHFRRHRPGGLCLDQTLEQGARLLRVRLGLQGGNGQALGVSRGKILAQSGAFDECLEGFRGPALALRN